MNYFSEVPFFIQALEPWQYFFMGLCEGRGVRGEFDMVHLKRIPPQCKHLTGKSCCIALNLIFYLTGCLGLGLNLK